MVAVGLPYSWQQQCASHPCPASRGGGGPSQTEGLVGPAPDTTCVVRHMSHEMSVCQNCSLLVACGKPAGQGEKGVTPCRCRCSASKAAPRRPHRSLYTASPARDATRSRAAKPAVRRWGGSRGPNTAAAWGPPRVHCYPGRAIMVRLSTGHCLPPRTRGTWGRRRPGQAWPAAAGGMGSRGLTGPRGPVIRPAAQTAADRPRPAVPR